MEWKEDGGDYVLGSYEADYGVVSWRVNPTRWTASASKVNGDVLPDRDFKSLAWAKKYVEKWLNGIDT